MPWDRNVLAWVPLADSCLLFLLGFMLMTYAESVLTISPVH